MSRHSTLVFSCLLAFARVASAQDAAASPSPDAHVHPATAPGSTGAAVAVMVPVAGSGVTGVIRFTSTPEGTKIEGKIEGLKPGLHGFHVHEFGDVTGTTDGNSAGSHYNPTQSPHGDKVAEQRHVGDLGNLEADASGVATVDITDKVLTLDGATGVVGRALVVHADPDKFTQPTGEAGGRVGFGVIGWAKLAAP